MKCFSCGAEITEQDINCPYCGKINLEAKKRAQEVERINNENEQLKQQVLSASRLDIYYKIHKKINIILFVACIIAAIVGITIYSLQDKKLSNARGELSKAKELYESGRLEELYLCLSDADALSKEGYEEYGKAALLWKIYRECQNDFAKSLDKYNKNGVYDSFYLRKSVEEGYQVLTNYVSIRYYSDDLSDKTKELMADYKDDVIALFTGIYQIPEDRISSLGKYEYKTERELVQYVTGVLKANE